MDSSSPSPIALFPICLVNSLTWLICCYLSPPTSLEKEIIKVFMKLIIYFDFIYFKNKSPKMLAKDSKYFSPFFNFSKELSGQNTNYKEREKGRFDT